jgi:hypothetical protein
VTFPFVVGCPRSGTTLLRAMLDSHPQLAIPGESYFIVELAPKHTRRFRRFDAGSFADDVLRHERFQQWSLPEADVRNALERARPRRFADAVRVLYEVYASREGKPRYGDKTPNYVLQLGLLGSLFDDGRFVHVVRDGRDVALSVMGIDEWGPKGPVGAARYWVRHVEAGRDAGRALGERYLEVRYDQLVDAPQETLAGVATFLELDYDDAMLSYPARFDDVIAPDLQPEIHQRLRRPPTKGLRSWREQMSHDDVAAFEAVAGDALAKFGFDVVTV